MPLDLGDLNEFFDGGMYATVDGKQYRIPPASGEIGLWGRQIAAMKGALTGEEDPTPEEQERLAKLISNPPMADGLTFNEALLSPKLHAELLADGVDDEMIGHMAQIVFSRIVGGDAVALAIARGDDPKAKNRAERRAAAKAAKMPPGKAIRRLSGSGTTSTAEEPTTRSRASGRTTTTRKASSGSTKAASRGRKS